MHGEKDCRIIHKRAARGREWQRERERESAWQRERRAMRTAERGERCAPQREESDAHRSSTYLQRTQLPAPANLHVRKRDFDFGARGREDESALEQDVDTLCLCVPANTMGLNFFMDSRLVLPAAPKVLGAKHISNPDLAPF